MAGHAQLKFVMTECSKAQIRLTQSICTGIHILSYIVKSGTSVRNIAVATLRPVARQDSLPEITFFRPETV